MPDKDGNTKADAEALPQTSLHADKEPREEDIKGNPEKLESDDPKDLRQSEVEDPDELGGATPKH
jgi:hypothetical protein